MYIFVGFWAKDNLFLREYNARPMKSIKIKKIIQETPNAITLILDGQKEQWSYKAGQFITVGVDIDGKIHRRSYSLATYPESQSNPAITIKRVKGGLVSNYLPDHLTIGSEILVSKPHGKFTLPASLGGKFHLVLIAGGSGITPLYAILQHTLAQYPQAKITLIYANRKQISIIYKKSLDTLAKKHKGHFTLHHILSQPSADWQGLRGRLTNPVLQSLLRDDYKEAYYFLCGPEGLMDMARATLFLEGVPPGQVFQENFTPLDKLTKMVGKDVKATIFYRGEEYKTEAKTNTTLLDIVLDLGIDAPFSCSGGICNVCRAKCLKGTVEMLSDEGLSEEEKQAGYVLTCVGYPTSDEVVLEVE